MFRKVVFRPTVQFLNYASTSKTISCKKYIKPIYSCSARALASIAPKYNQPNVRDSRVENVVVEAIDDMLSKLDFHAKQSGRVRRRFVEEVFEAVKRHGAVSSIQSLYLIRCCGSLMREVSPAEKNHFVNEMWTEFQKLGVPMDASHYNSLLKVYVENGHVFVPTDFLSSMEKNGVTPNRVTYQRLIEKYCEDGNIEGASVVLDYMKQKDISVNAAVFNFLIKGHSKNGDMDGARQILGLMRKSKLAPTIDTFLILARYSAERGDIDAVFSIIEEAEKDNVYFLTVDYLQLVYDSVVHGHADNADKFLKQTTNLDRYRHEIGNTVLDLLNKGFDEYAYKVLLFVTEQIDYRTIFPLFVKQLVRTDKPVDKVFDYCIDMKNRGLDSMALFHVAAKTALAERESEYTLQLFDKMQKEGVPIRSHYFWPIFVAHRKDMDKIASTLKAMYTLGVPLNFDTYMDYILPNLPNQDLESVIAFIKETGHPEESAIEPLFHLYCMSCDLKNLLKLLTNFSVPVRDHFVLKMLASHYSSGNTALLLQVLQHLSEHDDVETHHQDQDLLGKFLLLLLDSDKLEEKLLVELCQTGVIISRASADQLCSLLQRKNPDMIHHVRNLQFGMHQPQRDAPHTHVKDMGVAELEERLEELRKVGASTRAVLKVLLIHYCKMRNSLKVKEIFTELDEQGFVFTPSMYALMIGTFSASDDFEEARKLKTRLDEEFPEFKLDAVKVLNYAALLVKSNELDEAKRMIKSDCQEMVISVQHDALLIAMGKFLDAASESEDAKYVSEMYNLLMKTFSITTPTSRFLQCLVKVHLHMGNIDKAIEEYKHCIVTYRQFPARNLLLETCIRNNDNERLQRVVDLTTMYGEKLLTLHELALVFIQCGCFQQAYRVIQQLGDRVNDRYLSFMCNQLFKDGKITELEQLLNAVKDLFHLDRDELYYFLLQLYAQNNDCEKALELWNVFQEANIQPSVKTLRLLADLLENNDQPIPFVVPVRKADLNDDMPNELTPAPADEDGLVAKLSKCLVEKNIVEVVAVLREMKKGHIRLLSTNTVREIIDLHATNNRLADIRTIVQFMSYTLEKPHLTVKPLLQEYAEAGNVDLVRALVDFLPDFALKSINFNYYFYKAFLKSGKTEELLTILKENLGTKIHLFSVTGFQDLLKNAPELEGKIVKLVDDYANLANFDLPRKTLWSYYFINGKYDEAEELFKQNLSLFNNFDVLSTQIMRAIRTGENVDLGKKYLSLLETFEVKRIVKDKAYSCVLDTLVRQKALDEAVELLKTSQEQAVPMGNFDPVTLIHIKSYIKEKGQTLPFAIPVGDDDSSSSSDSD